MAGSEFEEKKGRVIEFLQSEGLDAVVLNSQHNFAWITCGASNAIDTSRENGAASVLIAADGRCFLLANNIEMPRMLSEQVEGLGLEPVEYSWQSEKVSAATARDAALTTIGGRGWIATDIPMFEDVPAVDGKLAALRYQLTDEERTRFKELGRDAGAAMVSAAKAISPGQSELEVAEIMRHEFAARNISLVVSLVGADERVSAYRHPVPTNKRWDKTVLIVACAKRHGLIASLSRMISNGPPDDELVRKTEAAAFVNASLWHSTGPGTTGAELYRAAADAYEKAGFGDEIGRHHQGGAAGYRTREWVAHPECREMVLAGQAFAWNPSITGTKVEETVIVDEFGIEVLTASNDFPVITTVIDGREYHSPGILTLS
ncbi:MAG: M24 family metallopeptidase [Pyrinomonadaceae bacterium]